jgi:hypothetical protein
MKANPAFDPADVAFWAYVKAISEGLRYTERKSSLIRIHSHQALLAYIEEIKAEGAQPIQDVEQLADRLHQYFVYRAELLNGFVEPRLMDAPRAELEFNRLYKELAPKCPLPMNKQKGEKKASAYFTGIINMLIEHHSGGQPCDYDPRQLTKFTKSGRLAFTMSRRVDGCFPKVVDPIAIWEVKEYYYTTTFGSRVADGVYEVLLDGIELRIAREVAGAKVANYLFVDSHYTWWNCGRSYLCRLVDMLNMGFVTEIIFGLEVLDQLPVIVESWMPTSG